MRVKGTPISDPPLRLAPRDESDNEISRRNIKRERERERKGIVQFASAAFARGAHLVAIAPMTLNYSLITRE